MWRVRRSDRFELTVRDSREQSLHLANPPAEPTGQPGGNEKDNTERHRADDEWWPRGGPPALAPTGFRIQDEQGGDTGRSVAAQPRGEIAVLTRCDARKLGERLTVRDERRRAGFLDQRRVRSDGRRGNGPVRGIQSDEFDSRKTVNFFQDGRRVGQPRSS